MATLLDIEYQYHDAVHISDEHISYEQSAAVDIQEVSLTGLPKEWLEICAKAARQGDEVLLVELISQLDPEYKEQAQLVTQMTKNLQFSQLVDLIEGETGPVN